MHMMRMRICRKLITGISLSVILVAGSSEVLAETLSLKRAETIALSGDPSIQSVYSRQSALNEMEVAAGQLPDPLLKMGVMSLPVDSFDLSQEPMTQLQLGIVQKFPRGDSRALRAEQFHERAKGMGEVALDLELRIQLAVREEFFEVLKQQRLAEINREAEAAFGDLEEITQEYYATGRVQQQDVLRAAVEFAKVQERSSRIAEQEEQARARLGMWIQDAAWEKLIPIWPTLTEPSSDHVIGDALSSHPRVLALSQDVLAADKGVELAAQNYKPEFAIDLSYGGRGGSNPDGSSRSDMLTFMVMMDVPLFHDKRQDRLKAASIAESSAAAFNRDDIHRRMRSEVNLHSKTLQRQRERLALFEQLLLPEAEYNANATLDAYQAALEDLTTLMRARITEFDLQLDHVRLQAETSKTVARLLYLEGNK
jgi:outer membrane protein TolC